MQDSRTTCHWLRSRPYPALLSLVIPMYNEERTISYLRAAVTQFSRELDCNLEVIAVNDGSSDGTFEQLNEWAAHEPEVKVLHLSRNFGHQNACTAGIDFSAGDAVVIIDADLQDPLSVIHEMIERYREGYDVVYGQREAREGETPFKRLTAWLFYRSLRLLADIDIPVDAGDFRLISRHCLAGLQQLRETHRFLRGMIAWVGYPHIAVRYRREPRVAGETKYPLRRMLRFAWVAATSFSTLPLRFAMLLGVITTLLGCEEAVRAILAYAFGWYTVPGWASLVVLVSLMGGTMLVSIGIVGEYIGKLYEQSKHRPLYLVASTMNLNDEPESRPYDHQLQRRKQAPSRQPL